MLHVEAVVLISSADVPMQAQKGQDSDKDASDILVSNFNWNFEKLFPVLVPGAPGSFSSLQSS